MGKTPPRKEYEYWEKAKLPWVSIADLVSDGTVVSTKECVNEYAAAHIFKNRISKAGTLLMSFKLTVGKVSILGVDAYHNEAIISIYPFADVEKTITQYLFATLPLLSQEGDTKAAIKGNTLNSDSLNALLIPLPPIAEQRRIYDKLQELIVPVEKYSAAETAASQLNIAFPERLRKSILQIAIQGKLVEQNPSDEPASVLLERIHSEKERLIAEGKIKRDKNESVIFRRDNSHYEKINGIERCIDDEIPFEIPDCWVWVHVGDVFQHNTGKAMNKSATYTGSNGSIRPFITTSNVYWNRFDFSNIKKMFFSEDEYKRCSATKNDILICEGGAYYGRTAVWKYDYDICFQNHIHRLRSFLPMNHDFFYYVFRFYRETGLIQSKGTAMPGLSSKVLHNLKIPLPPLSEQNRIVKQIEAILPMLNGL